MTAEILRRAAALMRERAEGAVKPTGAGDWFVGVADDNRYATVRSSGGQVARGMDDDEAEHIASWHPAVALAVADWLEQVAEDGPFLTAQVKDKALAVARAYLGETS